MTLQTRRIPVSKLLSMLLHPTHIDGATRQEGIPRHKEEGAAAGRRQRSLLPARVSGVPALGLCPVLLSPPRRPPALPSSPVARSAPDRGPAAPASSGPALPLTRFLWALTEA